MASHALLIGVGQFQDERLAALNGPAKDVPALCAVLKDPERGGFQVVPSVDDDFLTIRDKLAALFENRDPGDLVLLYYSGHGIPGRGNRLYLATGESDLDRPQARSLMAGEIRDLMEQTRAERQVVVLDCCFSGIITEGVKAATAAPAVTEDTFGTSAVGRYVLTSSNAQQFAWDGASLPRGDVTDRGLSRFTSWLVDGLGRGDAAPDPDHEQITMDALFNYVSRRAKTEASQATPQRYVDRSTGDIVIGRNPAAVFPRDLRARLASENVTERLEAAEYAGNLLKHEKLLVQAAARKALEGRFFSEHDPRVQDVLFRLLGLPFGQEPDILKQISLLHTSFIRDETPEFNDRLTYYQIEVVVDAPEVLMALIESVTYRFDDAYPPHLREQIRTDRKDRFKVKELANGTSIVRAEIRFSNRNIPLYLNRFIDLRPDGPRI